MTFISGMDGCRSGWVVISRELETGSVRWQLCQDIRGFFLSDSSPAMVGIDIPIGLSEQGPRECDVLARKLLSPYRNSSVFSAPLRPVLYAGSYREACDMRFQLEQKKMSKQAWMIVPKIREVNELLWERTDLRQRVHEVHPEVCFYHMRGGDSCRYNKKTAEGKRERMLPLEAHFGEAIQNALRDRKALVCEEDDILDAFAALWSAERILRGEAVSYPASPGRDTGGLRMEMLA